MGEESSALPPLSSLRCDICAEYVQDPVTLPCLHSFCKTCLYEYNERACANEDNVQHNAKIANAAENKSDYHDDDVEDPLNETTNTPITNINKEEEPFCCPTCKDVLHLPNCNYYAEPFSNDRLARLVKLINETRILCENCQQGSSEFKCNVCQVHLCNDCWNVTHAAPIFRSHAQERLQHLQVKALPSCALHKNNAVEYFCSHDEVGVCQACLLTGDFKGKEYVLATELADQRKTSIEEGISAILEKLSDLFEIRKHLEQYIDKLDEDLETKQAYVRDHFASIRKALDDREEKTLNDLQTLHDSRKDWMGGKLNNTLWTHQAIVKGVNNIHLILNYCNPLELIYMSVVIENHIDMISQAASQHCQSNGEASKQTVERSSILPVGTNDNIVSLIEGYAEVPMFEIQQQSKTTEQPAKTMKASSSKSSSKSVKIPTATVVTAPPAGNECCIQ